MLLSLVLILSRYVLKNMPVDKRIALQLKKLGQRPIKTPVVARPWNERNGNCLSFTLTQLMQSACQLPAVCYVFSVRVGVGRRTHRLSNTPRESVPVVSVLCGVFCVCSTFYIYICIYRHPLDTDFMLTGCAFVVFCLLVWFLASNLLHGLHRQCRV